MTCLRWAAAEWGAQLGPCASEALARHRVSCPPLTYWSPCPGLSRTVLMCGPLIKEETHRVSGAWSPQRWGGATALYLSGAHSHQGVGPGEGLAHRGVISRCALCPFQRLHDLVLPLVMGVQQGEVLGSSPYTSSRCRRELYRLLLALLLAPSPRCPPPLACALQAFSLGQREDSLEVTVECGQIYLVGPWILLLLMLVGIPSLVS